jgi:signal transduction histidine kinase/CheY-like chemotaxis protein/HPt (histidine-containing phosphotransfer) domain-containing protein
MGWKTVWQWAGPYVVAVISVAAAFVLKDLIDPFVEQELSPFLLCAAPVVFTAWYGGIWPGLFCVSLVGLITSSFFVGHEYNAFLKGNVGLVRMGIFLLEGVMISILAGAMHEARRRAQLYGERAETAYREAQRHVEELTRTKDALLDAQTGLRRAIADAQNANRAKSDFLANVSHELRTPLNAVIGMIDLSLQEKLTDDVQENLAVARESASMLLRLLNDLLDFSRIEVGRFELEASPFRLRETLAELMKKLSLRAYEKGLELAVQVHPGVPDHLVGDATRLEQVVANLVNNALKFTQQGEVVVTIEAPSFTDRKVCLAFCVSDTGIGISPEDQERIFAPFTQADSSSTREYEGIGLGLAISSQLVSAMEGRIWVESELGQGSRFFFTAWFDLAADPHRAPAIDADLAPLRGAPVLIVDDSTANRRILRDVLRDWRLRPVLAATAEQALERLRRGAHGRRFPVVLVDALMPGVSGFDLAETIQHDPELATAVVLMLSSSDKQEFSHRCAELDVIFLEKPVAQADLADALLTAYRGVAPAREQGRPLEALSPPPVCAHVLVVEDTPANQKVTTKILEKRGHRVTAADNGRQAVEWCQRLAFDVVVMDVQMPDMDGFQATAAIRAMPPSLDHDRTSPDVAIIAMTAHATRGFEERCLAAEMDAYLSKPVDAEKLVTLVESYAAGREPQMENVVPHPEATTAGGDYCRWDAESERTGPRSAPASLANVVDFDAALERMDGNRELLADMATFFLEDSPELLARIREGLEDGAEETVRRASHSLKGLASNFGAERTVQTARAIEKSAEAGDLEQAGAYFADLEQCVDELSNALQSLHV